MDEDISSVKRARTEWHDMKISNVFGWKSFCLHEILEQARLKILSLAWNFRTDSAENPLVDFFVLLDDEQRTPLFEKRNIY